MNTLLRLRNKYQEWVLGGVIAIACGAFYLATRPPLFDNDGYRDRLYALDTDWFNNTNPHHLVWNIIQVLIASVAAWSGHATTVPFQLVGILASCSTLFFLFSLLH